MNLLVKFALALTKLILASKPTYKFNSEHFQYVPERRNFMYFLRLSTPYIIAGSFLSSVFIWLFFAVYDSPETALLNSENIAMQEQIKENEINLNHYSVLVDSIKEFERNIYRLALDAEPLEDEEDQRARQRIASGQLSEKDMNQLEAELQELNQQLSRNSYSSAVILEMANMRQDELKNMPAIRPVPGNIISGFGIRKHPVYKDDRMHAGIDFMADEGTDVAASGNGTVSKIGNGVNGMGIFIEINHGNGYVSRYAHLQKVLVYKGQRIQRGQVIAKSGATGMCKGPHLYYQVLKNNQPVDPIDYFYNDLSPEQFIQFKQAASQYNESMN